MSVEIFKSTVPGSSYNDFPAEWFEVASFFSGSTHIKIIDSYSSHWWNNYPTMPQTYGPKRWKGDPIAESDGSRGSLKVWASLDDLGGANDWIVIECQTVLPALTALGYSLPKWQCKIQWTSTSPAFADVSDPTGVKYPLYHGYNRDSFFRFAPWGGWDLADSTPDFNPVVGATHKSTQNRIVDVGHFGSGNDTRNYIVLDNGQLIRWNRRNQGAYDPISLAVVMGDVIPVDRDYMPMPRAFLPNDQIAASVDYVGSNHWLCYDAFVSGGTGIYKDTQGRFGMNYWDDHLDRIEEYFRMASIGVRMMALNGASQPSQYGSDLELDLFPYVPTPLNILGAHFSLPGIRYGFGMGFHPINEKQWISMAAGAESLFVRWDGSSSLWP